MNDREKIIAALENCSDPAGKCRDCPYEECERFEKSISEYPDELIRKAVELLKDQEPRVLTLAEVESSDGSVWLERNMPEWETPIAVLVDKVGKYLDTFISIGGLCFQGEKSQGQEYGDYGKTWRCWSIKPTEEQRKAVKWDD